MIRKVSSSDAKRAVFWIGTAVMVGFILALLDMLFRFCLGQTDGRFTYGLDDPYIHLALAKNLAQHGVWGVTPDHATSASSSPLWTVVLAVLHKLGATSTMLPLLLGVFAVVLTGISLFLGIGRLGIRFPYAVLGALAAVFAAPLQILPFLGMEHCLQILLDVLFFFWVIEVLHRPVVKRDLLIGFVLALLCCACRYESVFLLAVPVIWSLYRKEWKLSAAMVLGSMTAIGGFAVYSVLNHMPLIPNSITLKRNLMSEPFFLPEIAVQAFYKAVTRSHAYWDLVCLVGLMSVIVFRKNGFGKSPLALTAAALTIAPALLHAALARVGYFYRYEAYLIVFLVINFVLLAKEVQQIEWSKAEGAATLTDWVKGLLITCLAQLAFLSVLWTFRVNAQLFMALSIATAASLIAVVLLHCSKRRLVEVLVGASLFGGLGQIAIVRGTEADGKLYSATRDIYLQQTQMSRFVDRYYRGKRIAANDIGAISYFSDIHLLDLEGLASDNIAKIRLNGQFTTATMDPALREFQPDLLVFYPSWFNGPTALPRWVVPVATWTMPSHTTSDSATVMFAAPSKEAAQTLWKNMLDFQSELPELVVLRMIPQVP